MEKIASIAAALIGVAMVAVIVQSANSAAVIKATGGAFANSVKAVMGQAAKG